MLKKYEGNQDNLRDFGACEDVLGSAKAYLMVRLVVSVVVAVVTAEDVAKESHDLPAIWK